MVIVTMLAFFKQKIGELITALGNVRNDFGFCRPVVVFNTCIVAKR